MRNGKRLSQLPNQKLWCDVVSNIGKGRLFTDCIPLQGPPGTVVPKALVLMECCIFVQRLNNDGSTVWLDQRSDQQYASQWDMFYLLRKWGDAVGEGLKDCMMREKEVSNQW